MKRFAAFWGIVLIGSVALAEPQSAPAGTHAFKVTKAYSVAVGKVDSVSLADLVKGTKSEIIIEAENGKKQSFLVKATTTAYDLASNAITLEKITKGQQVKIRYDVTKEGVAEAASIHIVK